MKAILFVFMLPFTMLFTNEQPSTLVSDVNLTVEENYELPRKVEVEVEVDFGRKKKGCSGFGVCSISGSAGIKGILDGSSAFGIATVESGQVTSITFLKASMNKKTLSTYFSGSQFVVGESFSASLVFEGKEFIMNLKAGKYRMQKTSNGFNIGMPPSMR